MLAYGTMKKSKAWKLYAKSQGIPFEVANEVSNQIKKYENALKHAEEDERDTVDPMDYIDPKYHDVYRGSASYLELIDSWSIAPCSYLLYSGSIRREIGLVRIKDNICCLMDGHWAEECHFLKNDLLTVKTVDLTDRIYKRIGIKKHTVPELLVACPPTDPCWDMYRIGATCCLNQVGQPGTSARVGKYHPTNISELCAFIAAIRPGFKSMYKTFEERRPFSYGVKAFDDLIQTEEMPYSFVLYQEMEMAALHFAGIPIDECYTAIKNIAKKRADKVLAYKEKFLSGFREAILREGKSEEEAEALAQKLWQIVEDSAAYSFNASHSYCVALDSLYGAWLKAHYPLEFYEVCLSVYDQKGDKDKLSELKEEAERYFKIQFPPFRFRQDNRKYLAVPEKNQIVNKLSSIKGFGSSACALLFQCGKAKHDGFFSVLAWLDKKSFKSAKVIPLIRIGYFQEFGNTTQLLRLTQIWDWLGQGTSKQIRKDKLAGDMLELVKAHATDRNAKGTELKTYTITDMPGLLRDIERTVLYVYDLREVDYRVMAQNQLDILGYLRCLYSNPCGFRLTAGMTTNYCQLKTIYQQRKDHRLPEWREFCQWILTLPMFRALCIDGAPSDGQSDTLILLVGPSGSGKSTIASMLELRNGWRQLRSYTTRPKRYPTEGGHVFISEEDFRILKDLMAYTEYSGFRYGATKQQLEESGIYVVDIPGVESLVRNYRGSKKLVAFCLPVDESQTRERMAARGDSGKAIEERLATDRSAFDGMEGKLAALLGIGNTYAIPQTASPLEAVLMIERILEERRGE